MTVNSALSNSYLNILLALMRQTTWLMPGHIWTRGCFKRRAADWFRKSGRSLGVLHGVPVGIKDIIDVRGSGLGNANVGGAIAKDSARS